jgi:hypothetical protein
MDGLATIALPPLPKNKRKPFPFPTPGDVARLIMLDEYPREKAATMPAAIIAAAACARIQLFQAVQIRIGTHWAPDSPEVLLVPDDDVPRPAHLLPIVQFAFRRVYDAYEKREGMLLFGAAKESKVRDRALRTVLLRIGDRLELDAGRIVTRTHDFFDAAIPPGTSEEMEFALAGPKNFGGVQRESPSIPSAFRSSGAFSRSTIPWPVLPAATRARGEELDGIPAPEPSACTNG